MSPIAAALDHLVVAIAGPGAVEPWRKLGFRLAGPRTHPGLGTASFVLFAGEGERQMYIEFMALEDRTEAEASGSRASFLAAVESGRALYRLSFRTGDARGAVQALGALAGEPYEVRRDDGSLVGTVVPVGEASGLGCDISLIEYAPGIEERRAARAPFLEHALPLRRLDHVAVVAPELAATAARWQEVLGLDVVGEIRGSGMRILQVRAGDAIVELLGPGGAESALASRPAGLVSMVAFEVADIGEAVKHATNAGFAVTGPREGVIPRSTVATVAGAELAGVSLQLLSYSG